MSNRRSDAKVDAQQAAALHGLGMTLKEIRNQVAPGASLMAVSRALRFARKNQGKEKYQNAVAGKIR